MFERNTSLFSNYRLGTDAPLLLIAGPCVIESAELTLRIAGALVELTSDLPVQLVFKASFDKANRTSLHAARGPGADAGLEVLQKVREQFKIPVTTDIHHPAQADAAGKVCELLQIPAFLCRQTDLLVAAARTGCAVNVKKGQFAAPTDMRYVVDKLRSSGCEQVLLCERGTFFGYGRLVNDMCGLVEMRRYAPVVFDATHSVQHPGSQAGATGGNREMVEPLACAAVAVGVAGLFVETHPEPAASPSDGANMVSLDRMEKFLRRVLSIRAAAVA